jgi:hypothetical protein
LSATSYGLTAGSYQLAFDAQNGVWNRWRNNQQGTLLASAARTADVVSPNQTNYNARGVLVSLNITAASGTGGLKVLIQNVEPVVGSGRTLNATPAPITATGTYYFILYPGASGSGASGISQVTSYPLPRSWGVYVQHVDTSSYTYSLAYSLVL